MKLGYITAHTPWWPQETFVLDEMLEMLRLGVELVIVPRNPARKVFQSEAQQLLDQAIQLPLLNWRIFSAFLQTLFLNPRLWKVLGRVIYESRSVGKMAKNLVVIPKATFVAMLFKKMKVEHIHAHWGTTPATMALAISKLTGIPWSMTLHRGDIKANNMLSYKVRSAAFTRCISEDGRRAVLGIVGPKYTAKVKVLHMGVRIPERLFSRVTRTKGSFTIACPATFIPVKGHRFLIEACALLIQRGIHQFECLLIGDGYLEKDIRAQIRELGLEHYVKLLGRLPHSDLLGMYKNGEIDAVVLPSVVTSEGAKEGIPVALMEAMAYGLPTISTSTGGIPELLGDGAGLLVPPGSPKGLADALSQLLRSREMRKQLSYVGHEKVKSEFNLTINAKRLLALISEGRNLQTLEANGV